MCDFVALFDGLGVGAGDAANTDNEASTKVSSDPNCPRASRSSHSAPRSRPVLRNAANAENDGDRSGKSRSGAANPARARLHAESTKHPVQHVSGVAPASAGTVLPLPLLLIPLHKWPYILLLKVTQIRHASGLLQLALQSNRLFSRCLGETGSSESDVAGTRWACSRCGGE